jgi:SAM-dependent methyltransferase
VSSDAKCGSELRCTVCGGGQFAHQRVLWDGLIAEWQLNPAEADYIDRQQGTCCENCRSNLRSIALADAIRACVGTDMILLDWVETYAARSLAVLEINEAGTLSWVLRRLPKHRLGEFPNVDMMSLPFEDGRFDLVVHSDTLEHVPDPRLGLRECRRVLSPDGGGLCFTVPMIVGRVTRSRAGLPMSYHGSANTEAGDLSVKTEFGVDAWTYLFEAGFDAVTTHAIGYPAATSLLARRVNPTASRSGWPRADVMFGKVMRKLHVRKDSAAPR